MTVTLPSEAPDKPAFGAPCNGCGICCAAETCPLGRIVFRQVSGPCPALTWQAADKRHVCGLMAEPRRHLTWLPRLFETLFIRLARRWIAAGIGCDSAVEIEAVPAKSARTAENSLSAQQPDSGKSKT